MHLNRFFPRALASRVRARGGVVLCAAALALSGCGYIGDPLPPLANIPAAVKDLTAVQRDSHILVQFTVPTQITEGPLIKTPLRLDLRIGTSTGNFVLDQWAASAQPVPEPAARGEVARYEIPSAPWTGKEITIAVRAISSKGKDSAWSNFVSLPVVPPPPQPAAVKAQSAAAGVRLSWEGPAGEFRIFRRAGAEKEFTAAGDAAALEWIDPNTERGTRYTYTVQRIVKLAEGREAESERSAEVSIEPKDDFPPIAPTGVRASQAPGSIELTWERSPETDLAGFRIYRAAPGGEFERIAIISAIPAFSDHGVEAGKTYRYAITAVDQAGNESPRSEIVEAALP